MAKDKFELPLPVFEPPKFGCPACVCDDVPPPADPGYAEAYMAGALAALGFHVSLPEWRDSLCVLHRKFYDTFITRCAQNQARWMTAEAKAKLIAEKEQKK